MIWIKFETRFPKRLLYTRNRMSDIQTLPTSPTPSPPAQRWQAHDTAHLVALIGLVLVLALPTLTYPLGRDQGEFATIAQGVIDGRIPYTELWNPKPPAIFYVYSAAIELFGISTTTVRLIDFVCFPAMALGIYWLGLRLDRRVAAMGTLAFGAYYFSESFWTLSQNDGLVLAPMLLAAVATEKALQNGRRHYLWAGVAGLLGAVVLWFKYPFVVFVLVLALYALVRRIWRRDWPRLVGDIAMFALGGFLVGFGGMIYFDQLGALDALVESAVLTSEYTRLGYDWDALQQDVVWRGGLADRLEHWNLLFGMVLLWPLLRGLVPRRSECATPALLGMWLLAGLIIVLMQAKGYIYHFMPMLPPLLLLALDSLDRALLGVWRLLKWLQEAGLKRPPVAQQSFWRQTGQLMVMLLVAIFMLQEIWRPNWPYLSGAQSKMDYYQGFRAGEFVADESHAVVDYLTDRTDPGQRLYIWGFRPEIYYLTQTRPATRFIFQFPLVGEWYPDEWRQQEVDQLWAQTNAGNAPAYVLILKTDYMPWVTGRDEDSNQLLQEYEHLNNWMIYNYEFDTQIGNFLIWRPRTTPYAD